MKTNCWASPWFPMGLVALDVAEHDPKSGQFTSSGGAGGGSTKQFASTPGGKTEYSHTTIQQSITPKEKANRKTAHEHAAHLKGLGHEGVKVTKRLVSHTVPGRGIGRTLTYTTHHGQPKSDAGGPKPPGQWQPSHFKPGSEGP